MFHSVLTYLVIILSNSVTIFNARVVKLDLTANREYAGI